MTSISASYASDLLPRTSLGCSWIHFAAHVGDSVRKSRQNKSLSVLRDLLEESELLDAKDSEKRTPLHWALMPLSGYDRRSQLAIAPRLLLNHTPSLVHDRDACGRSPLHYAVRVHWLHAVRLLLEKGAFAGDVNQIGDTPLHTLVRSMSNIDRSLEKARNFTEVLYRLGDLSDIGAELIKSCPSIMGFQNRIEKLTPLGLAMSTGNERIIRIILCRHPGTPNKFRKISHLDMIRFAERSLSELRVKALKDGEVSQVALESKKKIM